MKLVNTLSVAAALTCVGVPCNRARALSPAPAPFTLWNFLGIPQGFNKIRDATSNRFGNRPNSERQPPLKALADPANLMSPNPAIAAAAKIKTEEDLAPQKIKALKYLSTIGCGCYPDVKEALMGALDDCTEEVRYQAVLAIEDAAHQHCQICNKSCCCDQEMTLKLSQIAYERNDQGCWIEASERVREAAKRAMCACCPGQGPISDEAQPVPESVPEGAPTPQPPMPGEIDRGARRLPARRSSVVAGTQVHETSASTNHSESAAPAGDDADLEVVTVDFGNQPSQAGSGSSRVTASRRGTTSPAVRAKAPAALQQPPSSTPALGPSSRRAAVERGLAVPPVAAKSAAPKSPPTTAAVNRPAVTKHQASEISGWAWPIGNLKMSTRSANSDEPTSSSDSSAPVKASFVGR